MTGKANQGKGESAADTRLEELLRADAAAIADDDLDDETPGYPASVDDAELTAAQPRSQVYSIRVPVDRLEEVRRIAQDRGVPPTAMLREWVITRLDTERGSEPSAHQPQVAEAAKARSTQRSRRQETEAERLQDATAALLEVATQLTRMLAELITNQSEASVQSSASIRALPPHQGIQIAAALSSSMHIGFPLAVPAAALVPPVLPNASMQFAAGYIHKGLAELQATVRGSSNWPGIGDYDLDSLYAAADEELSSP